jgi:hypothetical protein
MLTGTISPATGRRALAFEENQTTHVKDVTKQILISRRIFIEKLIPLHEMWDASNEPKYVTEHTFKDT